MILRYAIICACVSFTRGNGHTPLTQKDVLDLAMLMEVFKLVEMRCRMGIRNEGG